MVRTMLLSGLALLLATTTQAVFVPEGLAPGIYSIPFDSNGVATSEPILLHAIDSRDDPANTRRQNNPPSLPNPRATCGNGSININDYQDAKDDFQNMCDKGETYPANSAVFYTSGTAIAYLCNFGQANRCWRSEYQEAMDVVVARCGLGNGGYVYIDQYKKTYGGDTIGREICL